MQATPERNVATNVPGRNKVALVIPYYGRLPSYFNYFLKSLEGKYLDVLLVTDAEIDCYPENLKIIKMGLQELASLFEHKLGTHVSIGKPIRLCDFKPMYGHIFEDYLVGYDYWGFGDCDLIYGNELNRFIKAILSAEWEAVSCRRYWSSGAFFIMKNSEKMRLFYRRCANWREVCAAAGDTFTHFDEIGNRSYFDLEFGAKTLHQSDPIDCFAVALWNADDVSLFREDRACEIVLHDAPVTMSSGDLLYRGTSIIFYHFVNAKRIRWFYWPEAKYSTISDYFIDDSGVYPIGIGKWKHGTLRMGRIARTYWNRLSRKITNIAKFFGTVLSKGRRVK